MPPPRSVNCACAARASSPSIGARPTSSIPATLKTSPRDPSSSGGKKFCVTALRLISYHRCTRCYQSFVRHTDSQAFTCARLKWIAGCGEDVDQPEKQDEDVDEGREGIPGHQASAPTVGMKAASVQGARATLPKHTNHFSAVAAHRTVPIPARLEWTRPIKMSENDPQMP